MSHIDSFRHELVGYLGYLPVYHPLEEIDGDFHCSTQQLVLGGGSGEHPALVIQNPTYAVALFLREEVPDIRALRPWQTILAPFLHQEEKEPLKYYEWDADRHESLLRLSQSNTLPNPNYGEDLERWLLLGIGEFVFFAMPELAPSILSQLSDPYAHFRHMRYNNILIVPPNMPVYANGGNRFFRTSEKETT